MTTINPLWTAYNNIHNEGGEGFNPHPKEIQTGKGEPLWCKLDGQAYKLLGILNGMSDEDSRYPAKRAEYEVLKAAAADARKRDI